MRGVLFLFFSIIVLDFVDCQDSLRTDDVVIVGTKSEVPLSQSGKSIFLIDQDIIQEQAGKSVADILNETPSVQMTGNFGTPGTNIGYLVRGASTKATLILIDGIPLNDPSAVDAQFDLRLLPLDQVESIEILRGGLSTLYGSGAAAAVVNIKLKKPTTKSSGHVRLHGGSFGQLGGSGAISGGSEKVCYGVSLGLERATGFSAASDELAMIEFEKDGYNQRNIRANLGYHLSDHWNIETVVARDEMSAAFDAGAFTDGEDEQKVDQFRIGLTPTYTYNKGTIKIKSIYNLNNREFTGSFPLIYGGRNLQIDAVHDHQFSEKLSGIWGVQLQQMAYEQEGSNTFDDANFQMSDPYLSLLYGGSSGLQVHLGGRLNIHSEYGSKFLYNVNPTYIIPFDNDKSFKVFTSLSSSNITPSLFQLFAPFFGNPALNPEQATNLEGGIGLNFSAFNFQAAYFRRDESNPIDFVSRFDVMGNYIGGDYQNIVSKRRVSGLEFDGNFVIYENLNARFFYSFVTSDMLASLQRIPQHKYGITLTGEFGDFSTSAKFNYTGVRNDIDFSTFSEVELESFALFDIYGQYSLSDRVMAFAAMNNVFDTHFIGIPGFTTRGRNIDVGIVLNW